MARDISLKIGAWSSSMILQTLEAIAWDFLRCQELINCTDIVRLSKLEVIKVRRLLYIIVLRALLLVIQVGWILQKTNMI